MQHIYKLIFRDGHESKGEPIKNQLTSDALNVCKLLAINPEEIATRSIEEFNAPGVSQSRTKLRFEYYEEKRTLKLRAIENVLAKSNHTIGKTGMPTQEALQVLALLDDMKHNKGMFNSKMGSAEKRKSQLSVWPV